MQPDFPYVRNVLGSYGLSKIFRKISTIRHPQLQPL